MTLKKYDLSGGEIGEEKVSEKLKNIFCSKQTLKCYHNAILENKRQRSANTKGRSEVKATGKKAQQQKGLGKARQGCLVAPHFRGGGVVFGPKPKFDQHVRINKKERRLAVRALLSLRIRENKVRILEDSLDKPKTKIAFAFFKKLELENKRVLVIGVDGEFEGNLKKSIRNIPKKHFTSILQVNGYQLEICKEIIITSDAFAKLNEEVSK